MACVESCPKNAIKIVDELDSYNAIINEEQCVNCDLCRKVCQNNRNVKFTQPIMWKQGWARDTLVRSSSSSGGVAQAIERAFVRMLFWVKDVDRNIGRIPRYNLLIS